MSNELKMKIPANLNKIDANDLGEFIWWCAHLGVSPEKLLSTIGQVGNSIEKIREQLDKRH